MTIDEIVLKSSQDDFAHHAVTHVRGDLGMLRILVALLVDLLLATGSLAIDLVAARRDRNAAHEAVSWMQQMQYMGPRGDPVSAEQSPRWAAYERAETAWHDIVAKLDDWIASNKEQP